jgi:YVTN family beta-propeller protein
MTHTRKILRRSAILTAALAALACMAATAASAAPFAYTANYDADSVSVIDTQTAAVVGEIEVGEGPFSVAMTPDGTRGFVANAREETVSAFNPATRKVIGKPIKVGEEPSVIAISPDGKTAYVSDNESNEVTVINTATDAVVGAIAGVIDPYGLAVSPDGKSLYVTNESEDVVYVVNTATLKVVGEPIKVGERPVTVVFDADGSTAYVADADSEEVTAINTATRKALPIEVGNEPWGLAITPDGSKLYVSNFAEAAVSVINTSTMAEVDKIPVGSEPFELGMTPDGKVAYLAQLGSEDVVAINTATDKLVGEPIAIPGAGPWQVVVAPDQSPTAAFTAPSPFTSVPATFSGAASTDPDGSVVSWNWAFGDGGTATGVTATHTYGTPGTFSAKLSVLDNEGCGEAQVFTGRTAFCSGSTGSSVTHPVAVSQPSDVLPTPKKLRFGRLVRNTKNGTVRLQVKLPSAGSVLLFGKKVHAVYKKIGAPGSLWLTIHARVELNKRLKKIHRTTVRVRVTFTPTVGVASTVHRSITLLHAPRKKK